MKKLFKLKRHIIGMARSPSSSAVATSITGTMSTMSMIQKPEFLDATYYV